MRMVLEHLKVDVNPLFKELYQIMKTGARLTVIVPHHSNGLALHETHHKHFNSFSLMKTRTMEEDVFAMFKEVERHLRFARAWYLPLNWLIERLANWKPHLYENSGLKALFPAYELKVILEKIAKRGDGDGT